MHYFFVRKVCRECKDSEKIYDFKKLFAISVIVLLIAAIMTLLYNHLILRLVIVLGIIVIMLAKRDKIIETIKMIRNS